MPTYEYHCDACEHNFDELQNFSEPALTKCPKCGKKKLRRLFGTGAALLFKGSGFYQTDYRSESYKSGEKKESDASKPATPAADASKPATEVKPAADGASSAKPSKPDKAKK
jgi:putative FmdB family regulatory protein